MRWLANDGVMQMEWNLGNRGIEVFEFVYTIWMIFSAFTALTVEILRSDTLERIGKLSVSNCISHSRIVRVYIIVLCHSISGTMEYYLEHISHQQLLKHLARSIPWLPKCSTDLRVR